MKSIGGFFELEMRDAVEYHRHALRLNSGRNALEYVLRARRYRKVHLPLYTCDVLFQPIVRLGIASAVYHINEHFEPVFDFASLRQDEALVYVNYFGLFDDVIESVAKKCSSLIVDNAQAFYARPVPGVDTFYSPRKFFGIPDGAYLYTDHRLTEPLERDKSYERCEHLLRRIDRGPEDAYPRFLESDEVFDTLPLRRMSSLTCRLLKSIDYDEVARRRISNFGLLHEALKGMNSIDCEPGDGQVPMVYPFLGPRKGLRDHLISKRIYVARYWPKVLETASKGSVEYEYAMNLVPLPVDHRYDASDMEVIASAVIDYKGKEGLQ